MTVKHRAAVCGKPIGHSLSPVIHAAGFAAAGLLDWSYTAFECAESELPALVAGLGPEWAGLSLTMPLKEAGLALAGEASAVAVATGAANTLVRRDDGTWFADNTDVPGMVRVLRDAGLPERPTVTVLGGGGTARAAVAAAAHLGAAQVTLVTRRPEARDELAPVAEAFGVALSGARWQDAAEHCTADAVISTVPKGAADALATRIAWKPSTVLFDAIYDPWPTPLAAGAAEAGVPVVSGLDLLLAQALGQFEQFTGVVPAPERAMREALAAAASVR
ncbi:shikimate dehydrogenase [Actinoplanes sp. RD1]|uniref:shikimate dehydrogenase n=1 Tax=Actinoplanes sp. RD1 TaxID=3064538 RepID=UPI002740981A|nr:shikimate dehydrogenase [Actinoplanes sp. RD1]